MIALSKPSAGANLVLAMLPRAMAYAAVAGVPPAYGLYASGAAPASAAAVGSICSTYCPESAS